VRVAIPGDGVWRALAAAMAEGRTIAALRVRGTTAVTAALVCRPGRAMPRGIARATERDLGADQSNTSVVLDERVLVKTYRRIQPGLNPELELVAFLTEEAAFPAVPPLAGFAEVVSQRHGASTVAIAQTFIAKGSDAYEAIAESLVAWLLAPGEISVEWATEVVADLGTLTAGLHAALSGPSARSVPELAPRDATRKEIDGWATTARRHLAQALEVTKGEAGVRLHDLAPAIAEGLTTLRALPNTPRVIRAHGDYHLGQVLIAPDGYRVIDFEGDPMESIEARRAHRSPLRDVASMLRSLDHVGRSAGRRAQQRNGGPLARPGVDLDGWFIRARERFLETYQAGLRDAGVRGPIDVDLLRAFEIDKETTEFTYASTYLPSWLWAPTEGMTWLVAGPGATAGSDG
jgi:maltose alpha-D-glucosyltransferase / alpha-amylase